MIATSSKGDHDAPGTLHDLAYELLAVVDQPVVEMISAP
jgi:hypothetical protein